MNTWRMFFLFACVPLSPGCSTTPTTATPKPAEPIPGLKQTLVLISPLLPATEIYSNLNHNAPNYDSAPELHDVSFRQESREAVLNACNATATRQEVGLLAPLLVSAVFDYFVSWVSDSVQKEINEYTKSYQANTAVNFWYVQSGGGSPGHTTLAANAICFRYTREDPSLKPEDPHYGELAVDIVGQILVPQGRDYFQIRPLSVYFKSPVAKTSDKVAVAMQLSASGVWFDETRGYSDKVFDEAVFSVSLSKSDRSSAAVRYFFNKDLSTKQDDLQAALNSYNLKKADARDPFLPWSERPHLPLPPVSVGPAGEVMVDRLTSTQLKTFVLPQLQLTASISEVGEQPVWLAALSSVLKKEGSSISKSLTSAADTALHIKSQ